jgi:transcription elongation factor Elf1
MRDSQAPAPCPHCGSRNVSVLHATDTVLYLSCPECDRLGHVTLESVQAQPRRTSAAFRMTARIVRGSAVAVPY